MGRMKDAAMDSEGNIETPIKYKDIICIVPFSYTPGTQYPIRCLVSNTDNPFWETRQDVPSAFYMEPPEKQELVMESVMGWFLKYTTGDRTKIQPRFAGAYFPTTRSSERNLLFMVDCSAASIEMTEGHKAQWMPVMHLRHLQDPMLYIAIVELQSKLFPA
jgi:hypothetical protein